MTGKEDKKNAWEEWRRKENNAKTVNEDLYLDLGDMMSAAAMWSSRKEGYVVDVGLSEDGELLVSGEMPKKI
ncbi:hypothetical protein L202_02494 [Cryptococcus amylolentus CBS 6039]|uniref:Uncharacterized protein n=1 Tax=Cryptococcus amylolentus CBS 6039 TaxID=1295533 RepID=A0A1E3I0W0_9TREE|nr:hypothetical protein L202_02494 [Cryptococcus amylolentus CBS 6039]ODN82207.1 hypothetical protein L202_02494 [Cryptococcus amylolentus CBS 6039]